MALLSGEVETHGRLLMQHGGRSRSGWLCYPGKLKLLNEMAPRTLKPKGFRMACYPGKLKHCDRGRADQAIGEVPDGFAIRGS